MYQDTGSNQKKILMANNPLLAVIQTVHAETMPPAALQEIMDRVKGLPGFHCPLVSAAGGLFYCNLNCEVEDGHGGKYQWNHSLWGMGSAGGGAGGGTLYTDYTMAAIASKTVRCAANVTPVTVLATFWAEDSTLLATLTAGGYFAPAYAFTGGGAGSWSKTS
jgi:hypothetical protein